MIGESGSFTPSFRLSDSGIVPLRDLAKENTDVGFSGKFEAFDAREVVSQDDAAGRRGNQNDTLFDGGDLFIRHRRVACAERDQVLSELFDPGAAPDTLIVNLHIRVSLCVFSDPALIKRSGEGRACALQLGSRRGADHSRNWIARSRQKKKGSFGVFHTGFAIILHSSISFGSAISQLLQSCDAGVFQPLCQVAARIRRGLRLISHPPHADPTNYSWMRLVRILFLLSCAWASEAAPSQLSDLTPRPELSPEQVVQYQVDRASA